MRMFAVLFTAMLTLLGPVATAAESGLAIGLELRGESIRRTSITSVERITEAGAARGAQWTLRASTEAGNPLWSRKMDAPVQFHADPTQPIQFVLTLPAEAPGTRLTLLDEQGRPRWQTQIDGALLTEAGRTRRKLDTGAQLAKAEANGLEPAAAGSALQRQLAAERDRAEATAMARGLPPLLGTGPRKDRPAISLETETGRSPILPRGPGPLGAPERNVRSKIAVAARVVREDGSAPGSAFNAWLYNGAGAYIEYVHVPASGEITLNLPGQGEYRLDLQPPPPLLPARMAFTYSGTALSNFVLESGWLLEVRMQDAATGAAVNEAAYGWVYPNGTNDSPSSGGGDNGTVQFALDKEAELTYTLYISGPSRYPGVVQTIGPFDGDATLVLSLPRTEPTVVQVQDTEGAAAAGVYLQCESVQAEGGRRYFLRGTTAADGSVPLPMPRGERYSCYVGAPQPLISQWFTDIALPATGPLVLTVQRGVSVRFDLQDEAGATFTGAFQANWYDVGMGIGGGCNANPCALFVPVGLSISVSFQFTDPQWRDVTVGPERFSADAQRTLVVERVHQVTGKVLEGAAPASGAQVLAYRENGDFVSSIRSDADGNFSFGLIAGRYVLQAMLPESGDWLFRAATRSAVIAVANDLVAPDLVLASSSGTIALRARMPCQPVGTRPYLYHPMVLQLTAVDGRHIQQTWRPDSASATTPDANNECTATYVARVSPGAYALRATLLGWPERPLGAVTVSAEATRQVDVAFPMADRTQLWQPQVKYADGTPAANVSVVLYDDAQRWLDQAWTDSSGRVAVPWLPGWGVEMFLPAEAARSSLRRALQFGTTPPPTEIAFESATLTASNSADLLRLFGNGDVNRRYNILFIAEGYTGVRETFQDSNGNGVWDGVVWHDLNGDGVFNGASDLLAQFGNAAVPIEGSVPTAANEPFTDLNGDGVLSLDDRALFIENTHSFMRSLLGSDYWTDHRDAFNAYAYFSPSPQAGYDVVSEDGEILLERDTLYGAGLALARSILLLDRGAATLQGLTALPEVDIVVALINQPVPAGRANVSFGGSGPGVMVYYGGIRETSANGIVQSHEMGHFVGALCDEYEEFPGLHPAHGMAGPGCANSSFRHQGEHLPWREFVAADTALPTLDTDGVVGAFIGSNYYSDGAYRPTLNSTMRFVSPFFNAPSRAALDLATCTRTSDDDAACARGDNAVLKSATWWDPTESGWGLFTIDQGSVIAPGWFTYDLDGEPTWFLVPGAFPQADGSYRGDILRYTGVPYPQTVANAANPPTVVGSASLRFDGNDTLEFAYTINGATTARTLSRFIYGDRDIVCRASQMPLEQATHYSDLWWSPASSGWGLLVAHVGEALYATWYTYDLDGEAVFMVGATTRQPDGSYRGALLRQRDGTPYPEIDGEPPSAGAEVVGSIELRFENGNIATFNYEIGQTSGSHAITRLQFGDTTGICEAVPAGSR
jgi:hypothetical protein